MSRYNFKIGDWVFKKEWLTGNKLRLATIVDINIDGICILIMPNGKYFETSIDMLVLATDEEVMLWKLTH
jgi:hypothetical protein